MKSLINKRLLIRKNTVIFTTLKSLSVLKAGFKRNYLLGMYVFKEQFAPSIAIFRFGSFGAT